LFIITAPKNRQATPGTLRAPLAAPSICRHVHEAAGEFLAAVLAAHPYTYTHRVLTISQFAVHRLSLPDALYWATGDEVLAAINDKVSARRAALASAPRRSQSRARHLHLVAGGPES
jgi:hypothetical protein